MSVNIGELLAERARDQADEIGLVEAATGKNLSFQELNGRADAFAWHLQKKGVRAGERVMLMVKPSADFICLSFALFKLGAVVILIDPGMGYKNLLRCIAGVQPQVFIGIPLAHLFRQLFRAPFRSVRISFCCGSSWGLLGPDICKEAGIFSQPFPAYPARADELAAIIFTTGSTGPPKGVRYEHGVFNAQLRLIRDYYQIGPGQIDQPGFSLFALFSTALGARAVIPDMDPTRPAKVDPQKFVRSLREQKVTYSFGSPAIWNVVSRYCQEQGIVLESLQQVLMAGAPIQGDLIARMQSILPLEARIHTPYGATESLPIVSMEGKEIVEFTWPLSRKGHGICVGRPLPGIEIRVIALSDAPIPLWDDALCLPDGEIGEIVVRGDVVTRAYENNSEENRLSKIKDKASFWHRMGDLGYLDAQGRLWFCGRRAHRVKTKAGTLFTIPCEAIINEHPDVARSALVGIPDPLHPGWQHPVIIVEPVKTRRINSDRLLAEVRELAAASALTESIKFFLTHPDFPVDIRHNAKIFREKLSDWAQRKIEGGA
ncbi:MAG: AMP-binding protein [Proteobacteria bacterium]|nr:AMP-binding protein [Pseudomonadota bacterium]MBU1649508.1 AMP-binding protein [Pseudomonadota bacterium]